MSYRFQADEPVLSGLRRIADEQIAKALEEIDDSDLDRHETVHQVRKRCKKIRGLLRLARPALGDIYTRENAFYRDASRRLSEVRDAQAMLECYDALTAHFEDQVHLAALDSIRDRLSSELVHAAADDLDERLERFRGEMEAGRQRLESWELSDGGWSALGAGLQKTYRRARERMAEAYEEPSGERFHEWRKRAKYHWYHTRLLREAWRPALEVRAGLAHDLGDLLGDAHDLVVLDGHLKGAPERFGEAEDVEALRGLARQRRRALEQDARPLGARLFAEKPRAHVRRLGRYWKVMREGSSSG